MAGDERKTAGHHLAGAGEGDHTAPQAPLPAVLGAVDATYDHLGHAVPSIAAALPLYQGLLGATPHMGGISVRGRHVAIQLTFPGGGRIELLQPLPGGSPSVGNFLERNPRGGLHHITFGVPDLVAALAVLEAAGFHPVMTSVESETWKETFLHPRETSGVLLQLVESHLPEPKPLDVDALLARAESSGPS